MKENLIFIAIVVVMIAAYFFWVKVIPPVRTVLIEKVTTHNIVQIWNDKDKSIKLKSKNTKVELFKDGELIEEQTY